MRTWWRWVLVVALVGVAGRGFQQADAQTGAPSQPAPEMTPADIGAFLDGLVPQQLARDDIAGAVVVVVKDGKILFAKGYGYADVERHRPVSPSETLFRVGSISKLFTWTALMQLIEQGRVDLDADVNRYLDFTIPPAFGQPVTVRELLTHTPGFQESLEDLFVPTAAELRPLGRYLATHVPARIYPPGTVPAYSNYGAALAGYIVERVSGMPFNDYVERYLFSPLAMTRASFRQPLPPALEPLMSRGYFVASRPPQPFEIVQAYPAGSLSAAGEDIAHFMIAQLEGGQYQGVRILQPETVVQMQRRQFGLSPWMHASALGFYEESRNGHRIIGHGGDTIFFHSDLHLMPDAHLGLFVSYNSQGRQASVAQDRSYLWHRFLDRYFPVAMPAQPAVGTAKADARRVAGTYQSSRGWRTSFMRLATLIEQVAVRARPDGLLIVDAFKDPNGQPKRWQEVGPMQWQEVGGQGRLQFLSGADGRWEMVTDFPDIVYFQSPPLERRPVVMGVLLAGLIVFALELLLWPVGALLRRHYRRPLELSPADRRMRWLLKAGCGVQLALVAGWASVLSLAGKNPGAFTEHLRPWLHVLQVLGVLGLLGAGLVCLAAFRFWRHRTGWRWGRWGDTAAALASLGYVWLIFAMHLLQVGQY